jgi:hypothetical protein
MLYCKQFQNVYFAKLQTSLRFQHDTALYPGRSVGIVRSRTKGHGVCLFYGSLSNMSLNFWRMHLPI